MRPTTPRSSRSLILATVALMARMDVGAAERAWQEAYVAALGSWRWNRMLEVSQADLHIRQEAGEGRPRRPEPATSFWLRFFPAPEQKSVEGVLRTVEARLGDRDIAEQCLALIRTS